MNIGCQYVRNVERFVSKKETSLGVARGQTEIAEGLTLYVLPDKGRVKPLMVRNFKIAKICPDEMLCVEG